MEGCAHCHNDALVVANNEFDIFYYKVFLITGFTCTYMSTQWPLYLQCVCHMWVLMGPTSCVCELLGLVWLGYSCKGKGRPNA
jgi:hypothetical protein